MNPYLLIIMVLTTCSLFAIEKTEHRRALLVYSTETASLKKMKSTLKQKGFIISTLKSSDKDAVNKYDRYINAIPTTSFNIIYYQGKIESLKDDMRFVLSGKRTIAPLRNSKVDRKPPVKRVIGSLIDLSERLSRKQNSRSVT